MQDGARCHTARETQDWLRARNVECVTGWPARSPDLNPIETLWAILQERVNRRAPRDTVELRRFLEEEWEKFDQPHVDALCDVYTRRLEACRHAAGAPL